MKVLHVTESMATGTLAMISSAVYSTNQYNIEIAYAPRGETPEDLHGYFPECRLHKLPRSALAFIVKLKRIVRDSEPDIVHFHSSIGAAYGRLALFRNRKIKLFYSPHCISFMRKDVGAIKLFLFRSCERVLDVISPSTYIAEEHYDPHVWMDVQGWIKATDVVAKALAEYDSENAEYYKANGAKYKKELVKLDAYAK